MWWWALSGLLSLGPLGSTQAGPRGVPPRRARGPFAAALLALSCAAPLAGCSSAARIDASSPATPCNSQAQCPGAQACFLGACRGHAGLLRRVQVEVRPPAEVRYGLLQVGSLDLGQSLLNDQALHELLPAGGSVVQTSDNGNPATPVPGASLTFTARESPIPGRMPSVSVQTNTSGGFSLKLPDLTWDVAVLPQAPLPALHLDLGLRSPNLALRFSLPGPAALLALKGAFTNGATPLAGALVLPVDAAGNALGAAATTDATGAFSLLLPPDSASWRLRVGPRTGGSVVTNGPVPSFDLDRVFQKGDPLALDLGALPAPANLTGLVVDAGKKPVAGARVFALSLDGDHWTLSRSTTTGTDGFFSLAVREGKYALEAVPGTAVTDPGLSGEVQVQVTASSGPVTLTCPPKVKVTGAVLKPDGHAVGAGAQLTATRLPDRLVSGRAAQVLPTDAKGSYQLIGDAGRYHIEIAPPRELGLPHRLVEVDLQEAQGGVMPDLVLWPGVEAVGTIYGRGSATPVPGAAIEFFALDPSGLRALSIGSAIADELGRYKAVLPDLPDPTDLSP